MHRPGHVEDTCGTCSSMNRRAVTHSIAALAGIVAGGALTYCQSKDKPTSEETDSDQPLPGDPWGYLTLYPPQITTITDARSYELKSGDPVIQIPFLNSEGLDVTKGKVVGFQLFRIRCKGNNNKLMFAIAGNLTDHDHPEDPDPGAVDRNVAMDAELKGAGYLERPYSEC